jgi:hypothetical protein
MAAQTRLIFHAKLTYNVPVKGKVTEQIKYFLSLLKYEIQMDLNIYLYFKLYK